MLSPAQIKDRRLRLGGSDMSTVVGQDAAAIMRLWQIKRGEIEPEKPSWPMRLGSCTERANIEQYEDKNSTVLTRQGDVCWHSWFHWAAVTLDAWVVELGCPFEAKHHVSGRDPIEIVVQRYYPQCQFAMECTNAQQCALSVVILTSEPVVRFIDRDPGYISRMMALGGRFWKHVEDGTKPVDLVAALEPPAWSDMRTIDMTGNNAWASAVFDYATTEEDAKLNEDAKRRLREMVPPDARKVHGYGYQFVRSEGNKLFLRKEK